MPVPSGDQKEMRKKGEFVSCFTEKRIRFHDNFKSLNSSLKLIATHRSSNWFDWKKYILYLIETLSTFTIFIVNLKCMFNARQHQQHFKLLPELPIQPRNVILAL